MGTTLYFMSTYKEYIDFCQQICDTGVPVYTVEKACRNIGDLRNQFIIIKHDVEDKPEKALRLSRIENSFGIPATYYVHSFFLRNPGDIAVFREIAGLGHEIGYHYDVLDNNNGDKNKAIQEFRETLSCFADNGFIVKTVCPHGNPLKKRAGYSSNKDFLLDAEIRKLFSDIVDVYITFPDLLDEDYLYITDARYAYFYRYAKTTRTDATEKLIPLKDTGEIIKMIKDGRSMIISIHSHRFFCSGCITLIRIASYKIARFAAKVLYKTKLGKYIIDKFYFLAKKI